MKQPKKSEFTSKQDVYSSFFSWFTAPMLVLGVGVYIITWWSKHGVGFEWAKQSMYLLVAVFLGVLGYSLYKSFRALKVMNSNREYEKLPNIPDFVMCAKCLEPIRGNDAIDMKCTKCGEKFESIDGFYDRHPDLK